MTIFILYEYTNRATGKRYIGVTNDPGPRFKRHANGESGVLAFNLAVQKYGIEAFDHKVLAVFDDASAAAYHEHAAIVAFGTLAPNGYNLTSGASGYGYGGSPSAETRARLSAARRLRVTSPETRAKMSASRMGNKNAIGHGKGKRVYGPLSAEHKAALVAANTGRKLTPEHKAKLSAAMKASRARRRSGGG